MCHSALSYSHSPEAGTGCELMLLVAMVICIAQVLITSSRRCTQEQCGTSTEWNSNPVMALVPFETLHEEIKNK